MSGEPTLPGLPLELRQGIYDYLLQDTPHCHKLSGSKPGSEDDWYDVADCGGALSLVCRQLRDDLGEGWRPKLEAPYWHPVTQNSSALRSQEWQHNLPDHELNILFTDMDFPTSLGASQYSCLWFKVTHWHNKYLAMHRWRVTLQTSESRLHSLEKQPKPSKMLAVINFPDEFPTGWRQPMLSATECAMILYEVKRRAGRVATERAAVEDLSGFHESMITALGSMITALL